MDDQTQKDVSEFSDEELRIKVAKLCGWKPKLEVQDPNSYWDDVAIAKMMNDPSQLPDYCNDLNAMHEVEKTLCHRKHNYFNQLVKSLRQGQMSITSQQWLPVITATARQRAEAFVKTLTP